MAGQQPSIPAGTRDFSPAEMNRRKYIFGIIEQVFLKYGYQPLETPAMENLSTLLGKYGDEGDKLLFRILNSGDFLSKVPDQSVPKDAVRLSPYIAEKGLRYDLTVPFARYVVQHRNEISFPFKRYQLQNVWRADRPQKGRYREFYQCDVDVIGSDSLLNELELVQIIDDIFGKLNIRVTIKLNNRKILAGIAEAAGLADKFRDLTIALDKLDKTDFAKVSDEMLEKGITREQVTLIEPVLHLKGDNQVKLNFLKDFCASSGTGMKGIAEMETILKHCTGTGVESPVELDITLARGLNYYTGAIIEVKARDVAIGSICGGGRYDNLTGIFGLEGVSGVGVSFGADRIYDVMNELNLFPDSIKGSVKVMFANFGGDELDFSLSLLHKVRMAGIAAEIYPDAVKLKKQFAWADQKNIPLVILAGTDEVALNQVTVKNMKTGTQEKVEIDRISEWINNI